MPTGVALGAKEVTSLLKGAYCGTPLAADNSGGLVGVGQHMTFRRLEPSLQVSFSLKATTFDCTRYLRNLLAEFTYELAVSHQQKQDTDSPREMCQLLNNCIVEPTCYRNKNKHANWEGVEPGQYFFFLTV